MQAATLLDFVPRREAGGAPARLVFTRLGYGLFFLFVVGISFTFLRPSPYDFLAFPTMAVWLVLGTRLHRGAVVFVGLLLLYHLGLLIALVPHYAEEDPAAWTFQSVYLMVTAIFFVMFFTEDAKTRIELALNAYLTSCLAASVAGIVSYFTAGGVLYVMDGRAAGVFEDPNVLGSFLVLGALYLLRKVLTGETRHVILALAGAMLIAVCVLLSFSRGSWAALLLGALLTVGFTFRSSGARVRRRIAVLGSVALVAFGLAFAALLTIGDVAETFSDRATITKDYDEGETGRFGNQRRSLPMLLERPNGFGPLRFRLTFGLEPHNSYIGGFANGGWLGGFAFLGLVLTSGFVGLRLCLRPSPYRGQAQVIVPALLMFFLQALQIDIDHWRHVYLMLGMVWGLECARLRSERADRGHASARGRTGASAPRPAPVAA